jgi:hypothetical protein
MVLKSMINYIERPMIQLKQDLYSLAVWVGFHKKSKHRTKRDATVQVKNIEMHLYLSPAFKTCWSVRVG